MRWIGSWLLELIIKKTVILITIQKRFCAKQIVLFFSLVRTDFLSSILNLENAKNISQEKVI